MRHSYVESPMTKDLSALSYTGQLEFMVPGTTIVPKTLADLRNSQLIAPEPPQVTNAEANVQYSGIPGHRPWARKTLLSDSVIESAKNLSTDPKYVPESLKPATKTLPPHQLFLRNMQES